MPAKASNAPRQSKPEWERDFTRSPDLGYESPETVGYVRCLSHGFPTPLARWHCHDEYELHLITCTSGKVFVGDWIGPFQPGQVILTGPRLPHNWVSMDMPDVHVPERDLVIQFAHDPLMQASQCIPELKQLLPMLERARHGIEFFGVSEPSLRHWRAIKAAQGLQRFIAFCAFMTELSVCTDYRLLSSVQMQGDADSQAQNVIHDVVKRITDHLAEPHAASTWAAELGMSESRFSRFFRKATGNTFTDFVNRVRISRACQLLMDTEQPIHHICYEVGFHSPANFNRRFLEIKGMTPSDFRRQSLGRFSGKL